jgi:hypothetical protein
VAWRGLSNVVGFKEVNIIDDKTYGSGAQRAELRRHAGLSSVNIPAHRFQADFSDISTNVLNTNPDISGALHSGREPADELIYAPTDLLGRRAGNPHVINRVITDGLFRSGLSSGEVDYDEFGAGRVGQIPR